VVYDDERRAPDKGDIYLQRFDSSGTAVGSPILINDDPLTTTIQDGPRVALSKGSYTPTKNNKTLAWNYDFGGWSPQSFSASAYCYQHSIVDPPDTVKILFAGPAGGVYNYGTQADDESVAVILTYQGPWFEFTEHPSFVTELEYLTLEASLDTGAIYVLSYRDYSQLISQDTIQCGGDCRYELTLPDELGGKSISIKIITGSEIDAFSLFGYRLETITEQSRK